MAGDFRKNAGDDGRTVDEAVPAARTSTTLTIRPQPLPQAQLDPGMLELLTSSENHARVLEARAVAVRKPAALHTPAEPTTTQVGGKSVTLGDEDGKVIGRVRGWARRREEGLGRRRSRCAPGVRLWCRHGCRAGWDGGEEAIAEDFVPLMMREPSFDQWKYNKGLRSAHQREGVSFLYECVLGMKREDSEQFGAILADEIGLGKTLQTLAFIYLTGSRL
ncbi:conserved hypothetical protein [Culex quinquefasciatus]|uniref:SNF2 N-terminal domain-containing protein n=1 Tax=Culex quinquefasciatus TaxID=7176 RepID=B0XGZ8_CULQU|nr:conserved hypothetical protein [Culex quinquefasciatus]|eukprot:XP_001868920.1 conserved hypothetical protein [Culex quinquefasciatus]